ncbi:ATPase [Diaporthe amygdali]|uniref:ATPase n=1 Tax=Phomopsis amygdali TaxID=1214568 RepID=UPI0022FE6D8A|nr:ATPase [Diaporthe amygdali]KAJ0109109.1 ATPase [Diaporthe amygdali]
MAPDSTTKQYFEHSSAPRLSTTDVISAALKKQYPSLECSIIHPYLPIDLLGFAYSGNGTINPLPDDPTANIKHDSDLSQSTSIHPSSAPLPSSLALTAYIPPARRDGSGSVLHEILFDKFLYKWNGHEFIVYIVDAKEGLIGAYPQGQLTFILSVSEQLTQGLILAAGKWSSDLHDEIWVYDSGYWQKSKDLYDSIRNASWDSVIMDPERKEAVIDDHMRFFNSRRDYEKLKVPWKRGLIFYGPPGNGKTISIKAMMNQLYNLKNPIPTLYVRSLQSYMGPEYSIKTIYDKARSMSPCYLIFEDLDTIITDNVKSYFFNEVDGLKSNDGIFMIGSTNHLDRLDPGISQRPSRFDRKYLFDNPNKKERTMYCEFWQNKLKDNKEIEFPDKLCVAIAGITNDFSFAYMQEAFVAALLAIARGKEDKPEELEDGWVDVLDSEDGDGDLDKNMLWIEIQKQIEILRHGIDKD